MLMFPRPVANLIGAETCSRINPQNLGEGNDHGIHIPTFSLPDRNSALLSGYLGHALIKIGRQVEHRLVKAWPPAGGCLTQKFLQPKLSL